MRNVHKILLGKSEGKRPFGGPGSRLENNNKTNFNEIGCGLDLSDSG
jgi:hypothetical protein